MKNRSTTGISINVFARLLTAGLMLGLLSPMAHAQGGPIAVAGNLSVKLQGIYTPSTILYIVGGKVQTVGPVTSIKKALTDSVEVTSLGLLAPGLANQAVNTGGITGCLTFEAGAKTPTATAASGTVTGFLSTNSGGYDISTGTFTATLNPAGLQVILQMSGTDLKTLIKDGAGAVAKKPTLVHAALNVLLRKTAPLPPTP
jgi:hypothetical protein